MLLAVAQVNPQRMRQMRCARIQAAQQNVETFVQRGVRCVRRIRFEIFQGIEQLHAARHHRVVLHALVVVVDLL